MTRQDRPIADRKPAIAGQPFRKKPIIGKAVRPDTAPFFLSCLKGHTTVGSPCRMAEEAGQSPFAVSVGIPEPVSAFAEERE